MRPTPFNLLFSKWAAPQYGGSPPPPPVGSPEPNAPVQGGTQTAAKPAKLPKVKPPELAPTPRTAITSSTGALPASVAAAKNKTDGFWRSLPWVPTVAQFNEFTKQIPTTPAAYLARKHLPEGAAKFVGNLAEGARNAGFHTPEGVGTIAQLAKGVLGSGEAGALVGLLTAGLLNNDIAADALALQGPLLEGFKRIGTGLGGQVASQFKSPIPTAPPPVASPPNTIKSI